MQMLTINSICWEILDKAILINSRMKALDSMIAYQAMYEILKNANIDEPTQHHRGIFSRSLHVYFEPCRVKNYKLNWDKLPAWFKEIHDVMEASEKIESNKSTATSMFKQWMREAKEAFVTFCYVALDFVDFLEKRK